MPTTISTGGQNVRRNCYSSSSQARLTVRSNGLENGVVVSPTNSVVTAGFGAPTVAPTFTQAAGLVPAGYYYYRYAYASSRYPFVANDTTGNGDEWPRSSPSPATASVVYNSSAKKVSVTCACTTRSDVDSIWLYRTKVMTSAADARAESEAGRFYYVGRAANVTTSATALIVDNAASDTGEAMDLDNFVCPLFQFCVFDGAYWWGWGNQEFKGAVTLDGTFGITLTDGQTFWGGMTTLTCTIDGIGTGGVDGRGTFFFKRLSATTASVYNDSALANIASLGATGVTVIHIRAATTTLYRSKKLNPFSWGRTTEIIDPGDEANSIFVSDLWAERIGGGNGTAISLVPNERILKLDCEGPVKSYALDLNSADNGDFLGTLRTLDEAHSVSSHFSQFPMRHPSGKASGTGLDAKSVQLLASDSQSQVPIGGNVIKSLRAMVATGSEWFHGVYDFRIELNCWFIKTLVGSQLLDTILYQHAPSGKWGKAFIPGISASESIYDSVQREHITFIGTEDGLLCRFLAPDTNALMVTGNSGHSITGVSYDSGTGLVSFSQVIICDYFANASEGSYAVFDTSVAHGLSTGDFVGYYGTTTGAPYDPVSGSGRIIVTNPNRLLMPMSDTVYAASNSTGNLVQAVSGVWGVIAKSDGSKYWICRAKSMIGNAIQNMEYIDFDSMSIIQGYVPGLTASPTDFTFYVGAIPCSALRYFNASIPEKDKQLAELWATLQNVDSAGVLFARFRQEYQETTTDAGFVKTLTRDIIGEKGGASDVYFTKDCPDRIMKSFGLEFFEVGFNPFRIVDFTLKQSPA